MGSFSDRFYRTLYEAVQRISLARSAKLDDYFGLVFRAVKADPSVERVVAFIRRMLQMCLVSEPNTTAASLLVISEVISARRDVQLQIHQFAALESGVGSSNDQTNQKVISEAAKGKTGDKDG